MVGVRGTFKPKKVGVGKLLLNKAGAVGGGGEEEGGGPL